MTAWTATDVALVVTTTATSLTAIAAFVFPPLTNYLNSKNDKRRKKLDIAMQHIERCVASMDEVVTHINTESIRLAYLKTGETKIEIEKDRENNYIEFKSAVRKIGLLARYYKIDSSDFERAVAGLIGTRLSYEVNDKALRVSGDNDALDQHWMNVNKLLQEVLQESAKLLLTMDKIL